MSTIVFWLGVISSIVTIGTLIWEFIKWFIVKPIKHYLKMLKLTKQMKIRQEQRRKASTYNAEYCNLLSKMINDQHPKMVIHHF